MTAQEASGRVQNVLVTPLYSSTLELVTTGLLDPLHAILRASIMVLSTHATRIALGQVAGNATSPSAQHDTLLRFFPVFVCGFAHPRSPVLEFSAGGLLQVIFSFLAGIC